MSVVEKQHIIQAFSFELAKVESESVRQKVVDMYVNVDSEMARTIAENVGVKPPSGDHVPVTDSSPALSQMNTPHYAQTMRVGVLIGNGFNGQEVKKVIDFLKEQGVFVDIVSEKLGEITGADGTKLKVNKIFISTHPTLFDSLYIVGGNTANQEVFNHYVREYISVSYKYYKPIGIATTGRSFINPSKQNNLEGVVFAENNPNFEKEFVEAIAKHRFWDRR
jgi:catalase